MAEYYAELIGKVVVRHYDKIKIFSEFNTILQNHITKCSTLADIKEDMKKINKDTVWNMIIDCIEKKDIYLINKFIEFEIDFFNFGSDIIRDYIEDNFGLGQYYNNNVGFYGLCLLNNWIAGIKHINHYPPIIINLPQIFSIFLENSQSNKDIHYILNRFSSAQYDNNDVIDIFIDKIITDQLDIDLLNMEYGLISYKLCNSLCNKLGINKRIFYNQTERRFQWFNGHFVNIDTYDIGLLSEDKMIAIINFLKKNGYQNINCLKIPPIECFMYWAKLNNYVNAQNIIIQNHIYNNLDKYIIHS